MASRKDVLGVLQSGMSQLITVVETDLPDTPTYQLTERIVDACKPVVATLSPAVINLCAGRQSLASPLYSHVCGVIESYTSAAMQTLLGCSSGEGLLHEFLERWARFCAFRMLLSRVCEHLDRDFCEATGSPKIGDVSNAAFFDVVDRLLPPIAHACALVLDREREGSVPDAFLVRDVVAMLDAVAVGAGARGSNLLARLEAPIFAATTTYYARNAESWLSQAHDEEVAGAEDAACAASTLGARSAADDRATASGASGAAAVSAASGSAAPSAAPLSSLSSSPPFLQSGGGMDVPAYLALTEALLLAETRRAALFLQPDCASALRQAAEKGLLELQVDRVSCARWLLLASQPCCMSLPCQLLSLHCASVACFVVHVCLSCVRRLLVCHLVASLCSARLQIVDHPTSGVVALLREGRRESLALLYRLMLRVPHGMAAVARAAGRFYAQVAADIVSQHKSAAAITTEALPGGPFNSGSLGSGLSSGLSGSTTGERRPFAAASTALLPPAALMASSEGLSEGSEAVSADESGGADADASAPDAFSRLTGGTPGRSPSLLRWVCSCGTTSADAAHPAGTAATSGSAGSFASASAAASHAAPSKPAPAARTVGCPLCVHRLGRELGPLSRAVADSDDVLRKLTPLLRWREIPAATLVALRDALRRERALIRTALGGHYRLEEALLLVFEPLLGKGGDKDKEKDKDKGKDKESLRDRDLQFTARFADALAAAGYATLPPPAVPLLPGKGRDAVVPAATASSAAAAAPPLETKAAMRERDSLLKERDGLLREQERLLREQELLLKEKEGLLRKEAALRGRGPQQAGAVAGSASTSAAAADSAKGDAGTAGGAGAPSAPSRAAGSTASGKGAKGRTRA